MSNVGDPYPLVRSPWGAPGPRPVTARPDAPELSAAELRFLDRPDAPESWHGIRLSPDGTLVAICRGDNDWRVSNGGHYRDSHVADWTPLAVVRGES